MRFVVCIVPIVVSCLQFEVCCLSFAGCGCTLFVVVHGLLFASRLLWLAEFVCCFRFFFVDGLLWFVFLCVC